MSSFKTLKRIIMQQDGGPKRLKPSAKKRSVYSKRTSQVLNIMRPELKTFYVAGEGYTSATKDVLNIIPMTAIAQGDDKNNRDGRKINPVGLQCRGYFAPDTTSAQVAFRRIIYIDWAYNGVLPTITDLLITNNTRAGKNYDTVDRFQILKDDYFPCLNNLNTENGTFSKFHEELYIPLKRHYIGKQRYCSYVGTLSTDMGNGNIFYAWITSEVVTANNASTSGVGLYLDTMVTFTDN